MHKGFKTELRPNNKQVTLLKKHCGAARFAYNWGLSKKIEAIQKYNDLKTVAVSSPESKRLMEILVPGSPAMAS